MQDPIFKKYGVDSTKFWAEVNALPATYEKSGIRVNNETIYLNHMITCVEQGIFPGLNNEILTELGAELEFYPGIPQIFTDLKNVVAKEGNNTKFGIHVEHYIISTAKRINPPSTFERITIQTYDNKEISRNRILLPYASIIYNQQGGTISCQTPAHRTATHSLPVFMKS